MTQKISLEDYKALVKWLLYGNTGISSLVMVKHVMGDIFPGFYAVPDEQYRLKADTRLPIDAQDFGRCYFLLKRVPYMREHLEEMRTLNRRWSDLVDAWPQLTLFFEAGSHYDDIDLILRTIYYKEYDS